MILLLACKLLSTKKKSTRRDARDTIHTTIYELVLEEEAAEVVEFDPLPLPDPPPLPLPFFFWTTACTT